MIAMVTLRALALSVGITLANSASAVERIDGPKLPPSANTVSKLTSAECKGLGGAIRDTQLGDSDNLMGGCQQKCEIANQSGVVRVLCIDEVKH
jgi:hypothetical protein